MALAQRDISVPPQRTYEFMPIAPTYAQGKAALDKACREENSMVHPVYFLPDGSRIYRSLTFRENLQAQVEDFHTLKDRNGKRRSLDSRTQLFTQWHNSCTSVTYKGGTTEFTIISLDEQLLSLPEDFSEPSLRAAYPVSPPVRLDSTKGKYNHTLTMPEVIDHEGWLAAVEGDQYLLRGYSGIIFSLLLQKYGRETGMGFYVHQNPREDMRRALFVGNLDVISNAGGNNGLNSSGSFLRVAHIRE